jgi:hypothetical protein
MNNDLDEKARMAIPALTHHVRELLKLARQIEGRISISVEDHFGFMSAFYLSKQIIHLRSIMKLLDADQSSDATLVARVMIDGMISLLWTVRDPERRALDWRSFAFVSDYRTLLQKKKDGLPVDPAEEAWILDQLQEKCSRFLTNRARKASAKGESLPEDPYRNKWTIDENGKSVQIETMFQDLEGEELYDLYSHMSDWVHWNPRGIGTKIKWGTTEISFEPNPPTDTAIALTSSFQSLHQIIEVVNEHFELGFERDIQRMKEEFLREFKSDST